jgi:hypothetical protein
MLTKHQAATAANAAKQRAVAAVEKKFKTETAAKRCDGAVAIQEARIQATRESPSHCIARRARAAFCPKRDGVSNRHRKSPCDLLRLHRLQQPSPRERQPLKERGVTASSMMAKSRASAGGDN